MSEPSRESLARYLRVMINTGHVVLAGSGEDMDLLFELALDACEESDAERR
jgi:hypothetical protein